MASKEAARRAWATVNAIHGGGEKPGGGGYGKPENHEPMRKGGRKGGRKGTATKSTGVFAVPIRTNFVTGESITQTSSKLSV